jgi:polyisoprenoid-binding protein YceI
MHRSRTLFLVGLLLAASVSAQKLTLELDPNETRVEFGFGATLHSVAGSLRLEHGRLEIDPATGAASGEIVLDAKSAKTGVVRRDEKMHQEILESTLFPKVTYRLERIDGTVNRTGRSDLQLHGQLELHGVRLPAAILAVATVNGDRVTATGTFTVPYRQWGMKDPSVFVLRVEKEVHIKITAMGTLKPAPPG